jgi:hypothetical protein
MKAKRENGDYALLNSGFDIQSSALSAIASGG